MQLLDHVSISVKDLSTAAPFYDAIMRSLQCEKVYHTADALGYGQRCRTGEEAHTYLAVYASEQANVDNRRHWCFKAQSRQMVDEFFHVGLAQGGISDGEPGVREHYHENYYAAFLIDPSGNRVEAVFHGRPATRQ